MSRRSSTHRSSYWAARGSRPVRLARPPGPLDNLARGTTAAICVSETHWRQRDIGASPRAIAR